MPLSKTNMTPQTVQQTNPLPPNYPFEEDAISLMDILLVLAKHLKLIIITPAIFCIITIIYTFLISKPIYISTATFMSSDSGANQSHMMGLATQFGFAMPSSSVAQWSYTDIIESRKLARGMLDRKFDTEKYGTQKSLLQILTYGDGKPTVGIDTLIRNAIGAVQGMIEINSSGGLYELEISALEPKLATDLANAVIEGIDKHLRAYNGQKLTKTREFIEERLGDTKSELEKTEEALKSFRENNRNIISSPSLQLEQERLARDVAVLIGVFTTLKQQLETAKIDEVKESDYVIILDEPETPLYPANPKKILMTIIAGLLGIGLGMILAFFQEYVKKYDEEKLEKMGKVKSIVYRNIVELLPFNRWRQGTDPKVS